MPNPLDTLAASFERFPGIGPRQARRFVHFLLSQSEASRTHLADNIRNISRMTASCPRCFRWFVLNSQNTSNALLCNICSSTKRYRNLLFVLEKEADIENVERGGFHGLYFVLGGTIPLAEETSKLVRVGELLQRASESGLSEIILGLSATTEGDHTRILLQEILREPAEKNSIKITSLGRGLSTGSELEYADPDTITSALSTRR